MRIGECEVGRCMGGGREVNRVLGGTIMLDRAPRTQGSRVLVAQL
jgi:hypothetical protein